jgi:membrane protein YdbS with pleckstrin-like domain
METTLWTVSMAWWQWVIAVVVALYVWEVWLEHSWYKFKHWVQNKPHNLKR